MDQLVSDSVIQSPKLVDPAAGDSESALGFAGGLKRGRTCESLRLQLYLLLLIVDLASIAAGFFVAGTLRLGSPFEDQLLRTLVFVLPVFAAIALNNRSYSLEVLRSPSAGAVRATEALAYAIAVSIILLFSLKVSTEFSRLVFGIGTFVSGGALVSCRLLVGNRIGRRHSWRFAKRLVIVDGEAVIPGPGDHVVFPQQLGLDPRSRDPLALHRLGTLIQYCDSVLVACPPERRREWSQCLKSMAAEIEINMPDLAALGGIRLKRGESETTLVIGNGPLSLRDRIAKRCLDVLLSFAALVFLFPLMMLIAVAIKLDSRGPALFRQERLGYNNRLFHLLKFRSMRIESTDALGTLSTRRSDERITRLGRFLRATSIDELPQLFNVLIGDMSLVGPRPHALGSTAENVMFWELEESYFHRHAIKPGITGLAQVRGFRGATLKRCDLSNRLHSDLEYLAGWTIWRDLNIIAHTFRVLVHPNAY